jgi:hypothetical protein
MRNFENPALHKILLVSGDGTYGASNRGCVSNSYRIIVWITEWKTTHASYRRKLKDNIKIDV